MNTALKKQTSICWIAFAFCPFQSGLSGALASGDVSLLICQKCFRYTGNTLREELELTFAPSPEDEDIKDILDECDNEELLEHLDYYDENLLVKFLQAWKKATEDTRDILALLIEVMREKFSLEQIFETLNIKPNELSPKELLKKTYQLMTPTGTLTGAQQKQMNVAFALLEKCLDTNATATAEK